ncbi:GPI ethanolamine phosphate transferase 1 [Nymphon striatum]|nr:GPI ethanolamine phosphate transferase 1 [Nymphon striatum]
MKLMLFGVGVHAIFLYSVFDIYFTSPISHGATPVSIQRRAAARRIVLFVADGLRADKAYELDESGRPRAPYLRNVIKKIGAWGISHTKVPTESRPGHVALIAGIFEDVSAIAKGWKENPVEFDSVFNQSRYTWSWGSPDILPMFAKGASGDHVFTEMYSAANEEFSSSEAYKLDTWVFDRVQQFFRKAKQNETLEKMVKSDKVVLFLHLLGLDTNGHAHKPMSSEYLENINIVDKGISKCVNIVNEFFDDKQTAFIMTSDHGMTNWGSHGSGDPEETLTPFVAWGAGIRQPLSPGQNDLYSDKLDFEWNLSHVKRVDLNQVDVAPLMASLIGINFPTNSMGIIPFDYLIHDWQYRADAMLANVKQLLSQFHLKQEVRKNSTLVFQPFKELDSNKEEEWMSTIRKLLDVGRYEEAVYFLHRFILLTQKGIDYYNRYDRFILSKRSGQTCNNTTPSLLNVNDEDIVPSSVVISVEDSAADNEDEY